MDYRKAFERVEAYVRGNAGIEAESERIRGWRDGMRAALCVVEDARRCAERGYAENDDCEGCLVRDECQGRGGRPERSGGRDGGWNSGGVPADVRERMARAAETYLRHRGYGVLEADGDVLVCDDGGTLVLALMAFSDDPREGAPEKPDAREARAFLERRTTRWLTEHPERRSGPVRYDFVGMTAVRRDSMLVKHETDWLGR